MVNHRPRADKAKPAGECTDSVLAGGPGPANGGKEVLLEGIAVVCVDVAGEDDVIAGVIVQYAPANGEDKSGIQLFTDAGPQALVAEHLRDLAKRGVPVPDLAVIENPPNHAQDGLTVGQINHSGLG